VAKESYENGREKDKDINRDYEQDLLHSYTQIESRPQMGSKRRISILQKKISCGFNKD